MAGDLLIAMVVSHEPLHGSVQASGLKPMRDLLYSLHFTQ
jgi:hypothetical protein